MPSACKQSWILPDLCSKTSLRSVQASESLKHAQGGDSCDHREHHAGITEVWINSTKKEGKPTHNIKLICEFCEVIPRKHMYNIVALR